MQSQKDRPEPKWTILELLKWTTDFFKSRDIQSPRTDAEVLLASALRMERIDLYVRYDQPLTAEELSQYKSMIKRRIRREPVAYIVGWKEFWSMDLRVSEAVLIPRPETECLVEKALALISEHAALHILDIGTGAGALALALASERPRCRILASDISVDALRIAGENARNHGLSERILFLCGSSCLPIKGGDPILDMILSNPPYIRTAEIDRLQPEIFRFEPRAALDGGPDGLDCVREIIGSAHRFLKPHGYLLLEIGFDQREDVAQIAESVGCYEPASFDKDYSGHDRVVLMQKKAV
jgi:release factor glutamine methyltransferase